MVLHAGIGLDILLKSSDFHVSFYDNKTEKNVEFEMRSKIVRDYKTEMCDSDKLELFFTNVKATADGNLGCLCIAIRDADNKTRKQIIDLALKIGFSNVKLIGRELALYFHAVSDSNYMPKNEDVIWIFDGLCWYIWHRKLDKAEFFSLLISLNPKTDLKNILKSTNNMFPNIVLTVNECLFDRAVAEEMFPKCEFFNFSDDKRGLWNKGALIQARIMAHDIEMMKYNADIIFLQRLCVTTKKFNDISWFLEKLSHCQSKEEELNIKGIQRFIGLEEKLYLPIAKTSIIKSNNYKNVLTIISEATHVRQFICLPINKIFAVTLNIDKNEIYDIHIKFLRKIKPKSYYNGKRYSIPHKFALNDYNDPKFPIYAIGIDLGTTRCCAAVKRRDGMETVVLDNTGERLLPSYVSYDDDNEKCGKIVLKRMWYRSKSTVFDSKRITGKKFQDIIIDPIWPFEVIQDRHVTVEHLDENSIIQFKLLENNDTFIKLNNKKGQILKYPEEVSAGLLKHIKQRVDEFQGRVSKQVVLTVPATFSDTQNDATCTAAILAGFQNVHLLPEPVAAAFAYLINQPIKNNFKFLLFDLGGGTLDICIFKCENNQIEIICQNGNSNLGGRNFDNILINYFSKKLCTEYGVEDLSSKKYNLMLECQSMKETLSVYDKAFLDVEEFLASKEGVIEITRKEFEEFAEKLLLKIKICIINVLKHGKFHFDQIDKILLAGGGSRMPMIQNLLKKLFTKAEFCCTIHPDEIVATGAAYYAYYMQSLLKLKNGESIQSLKKFKLGKRKTFMTVSEAEVNKIYKKFEALSFR